MVLQSEDLAVVHALAFEDAARIMEPVGQHVEFCIAPRDEAAIVPDEAVPIVERDHGHRIFLRMAGRCGGNTASIYVAWNFISRRTPDKCQRLRDKSICLT